MNDKSYILQDQVSKFHKATVETLEEVLSGYRMRCSSDQQFGQRIYAVSCVNNPNTVKYYFDDRLAFYTSIEFEEMKVYFRVHMAGDILREMEGDDERKPEK